MDAQRFIAEFGHIANAPGGIARLRELVLQLAISGRLIGRNSMHTPVDMLLTSASMQRAAYEARHGISSTRTIAALHYAPYEIPDHWSWVRLEQLSLYIQRGKGPSYADRGNVHVVSQKCVQWGGFDISPSRFIADTSLAGYSEERFIRAGDLLWNSTGTGTVGRAAIYEGFDSLRAVADSHVTVIRLADLAIPRYLWCVIASPWVQARIDPSHPNSLVSGTTQQVELATKTIRALPVPLPPTEEQSFIIAKVDELMALCDRLEAQQKRRLLTRAALRQSILQAVPDVESPGDLYTAWSRLSETFSSLFATPDDVEELRKCVLTLAVRGKLISQYPNSHAASPIRHGGDVPFELPPTWQWVRLGDVSELINGDRGKNYPNKSEYVTKGVAWINTGHIEPDGSLSVSSMHYITRDKFNSLRSGKVKKGDLVYCLRGATLGKTAIIDQFDEGAVASSLVIIRLNEQVDPVFAYLVLTSPIGREQISQFDNGSAQPNLSAASVKKYWFPLPPLAEQHSVVQRVSGMMRVCDDLASLLRRSSKLAEQLAASTVSTLTGVAIELTGEPVKAPKTELFAPLHAGKVPSVKEQAPLAAILIHTNGSLNAKELWQRYGGEIDAFYAQLKTEVANGWIREPRPAVMNEIHDETVSA